MGGLQLTFRGMPEAGSSATTAGEWGVQIPATLQATGCRLIDCKLNDYMALTTRQETQYRFWVTDGDRTRKKD
jgi:hypothetical protein